MNIMLTILLQHVLYMHAGDKEDVVNVEEQFLEGIYTPDFLQQDDETTDENDPCIANRPAAARPTKPPTKRKAKGDTFTCMIINRFEGKMFCLLSSTQASQRNLKSQKKGLKRQRQRNCQV